MDDEIAFPIPREAILLSYIVVSPCMRRYGYELIRTGRNPRSRGRPTEIHSFFGWSEVDRHSMWVTYQYILRIVLGTFEKQKTRFETAYPTMIEYADEDVYAYNCEWFEIIRPGAALWLIKRIVRTYEIRKLRLGLLGREFLGPFGDIGQPETDEDLDENREVMDWQVVDELNAILGITRNESGLGRFEERD